MVSLLCPSLYAAYAAIHNIDHVYNDDHNKETMIVILAKHKIAPWWWFLREPKHVGVNVTVLSVLTFLRFYISVYQLEQ